MEGDPGSSLTFFQNIYLEHVSSVAHNLCKSISCKQEVSDKVGKLVMSY